MGCGLPVRRLIVSRRLYLQLALRLVAVFLVLGALLLWLSASSMGRYSRAVQQTINAPVARYISEELELITAGRANREGLRQLAHHAMIIHPAIEVYLLDPQGRIISHALEPEAVVRERVDLDPVRAFLARSRPLPILGPDPTGTAGKVVFSAHPVWYQGQPQGYVYVVLEGQRQQRLEQSMLDNQVFRFSALGLAGGLAFAVCCALLLFARFSRRVQKLARRVDQLYRKKLESDGPEPAAGDELERLEEAFNAMQSRIRQQVEEIRQADAMRRNLIANVSHDLRTPLTNMLGYVETLMLKRSSLSASQREEYLAITRQHGLRLNRLVSDLFELAKLDSGGQPLQLETFSIAELVHDVVQEFSLRARHQKVTLTVNGDLEEAWVRADIRLLERVLENLLDNALRHTPAGGEVRLQIQRQADRVLVSVCDTGSGIPKADLPYVFDRFYYARDNGRDSMRSTGLGLAIVKRILDLHASRIAVYSRLRQGSRFEFQLKCELDNEPECEKGQ